MMAERCDTKFKLKVIEFAERHIKREAKDLVRERAV